MDDSILKVPKSIYEESHVFQCIRQGANWGGTPPTARNDVIIYVYISNSICEVQLLETLARTLRWRPDQRTARRIVYIYIQREREIVTRKWQPLVLDSSVLQKGVSTESYRNSKLSRTLLDQKKFSWMNSKRRATKQTRKRGGRKGDHLE